MATFSLTQPIRLDAVRAHFGARTASVVGLCSSSNIDINLFALRRPFVNPAKFYLSEEDRDSDRINANFGWAVKTYSTPGALYDGLVNAGDAYTPQLPDGSSTQPCRIADFRGYVHTAKQWVDNPEDMHVDSSTSKITFFKASVGSTTDAPDAADTLLWRHGKAFVDKYACVAWSKDGGASWSFRTADKPIAHSITSVGGDTNTAMSVELTPADMGLLANGSSVVAMLCLCSTSYSGSGSQPANAKFTPIPAEKPLVCTVDYSQMIDGLSVEIVAVAGGGDNNDGDVTGHGANANRDMRPTEQFRFAQVDSPTMHLGVTKSGIIGLLLKFTNESTATVQSTQLVKLSAQPTLANYKGTAEKVTKTFNLSTSNTLGTTVGTGVFKATEPYTNALNPGIMQTSLTGTSEIRIPKATSTTVPAVAYYYIAADYLLNVPGTDKATGAMLSSVELPSGAHCATSFTLTFGDMRVQNVSGGDMVHVRVGATAAVNLNAPEISGDPITN